MSEIKKPVQRTWYIIQNGTTHYGYVDPDQVMDSGKENLQIFLNEQDWLDALLLLGIDPNNEEI